MTKCELNFIFVIYKCNNTCNDNNDNNKTSYN